METNRFVVWDYVVFVAVLCVSAAIGIFYGCSGGKQKTTAEFLMADRAMTLLPVSLSLLASFMSAITLLGTPAEVYVYGTQYWMIWLGYCLMIPLAAHVYLPIFYQLKLTSVFEYLEMRFNRTLRILGALCFIVQMTLYMAIVLYTPALALNVVTGINVWLTVVTVGVVCIFYTTIGGMKAVMWTDVFQICMMFAGLIGVLIKGSIDAGGFGNVWRALEDGDRVEFFDFDPDPLKRHSTWSLVFGGCFTWLAIYGVNQAQIQRALCVPKMRTGQLSLWVNLPGLTALLTICCMCGMIVFHTYKDCDPLTSDPPRIKARDQLLPLYVMDKLAVPGIPGLFTACLFSGALSTISSGLNSLSAVTLQDFVRLLCIKNMDEKRATLASKIIALAYGILMIALTFVAAQLGGVLQAALALFGMIGGPLLGLYTLGMIYPWANSKGGLAGLICGLVFTLWLGIGAQVYKPSVPKAPVSTAGCPVDNSTMANYTMTTMMMYTGNTTVLPDEPQQKAGYLDFYEISYMWYSTLAVLVVNVVGMIVSLITGPNRPCDVDPKLLCPIFDVFCCYLPASWRRSLRCHTLSREEQDAEAEKDLERKSYPKENGSAYPAESTKEAYHYDNPSYGEPTSNGVTLESQDHLDTRL